jgi:hypothetical protein
MDIILAAIGMFGAACFIAGLPFIVIVLCVTAGRIDRGSK